VKVRIWGGGGVRNNQLGMKRKKIGRKMGTDQFFVCKKPQQYAKTGGEEKISDAKGKGGFSNQALKIKAEKSRCSGGGKEER